MKVKENVVLVGRGVPAQTQKVRRRGQEKKARSFLPTVTCSRINAIITLISDSLLVLSLSFSHLVITHQICHTAAKVGV